MPLSINAQLIYEYLVQQILQTEKVITYGEVSEMTGVPLGENGGAVRIALYEIFQACDLQRLPPLTSIVVQEINLYDPTRRHGMPGGGYLVAEARSPNIANRRRDAGWLDWAKTPRPSDVETWRMKPMIEAHQDSVWNFGGEWPPRL
jgi:hypothetical protein